MEDESLLLERSIDHPWVRGRAKLVVQLISKWANPASGKRAAIEIGCGPGNNLLYFQKRFPKMKFEGLDISPKAIEICRRKGLSATQADFFKFSSARRYDLVLMMDVLEHFSDDRKALRKAAALLRPGGLLVCTVPAHPAMYSYHDKRIGHFRRYTLQDLIAKTHAAGLQPVFHSFWNAIFYAPVRVFRHLHSGSDNRDDLERMGPISLFALDSSLGLENALISNEICLPVGLNIVGVFQQTGAKVASVS